MTINFDHLDTPIPAKGAPFEFRGQTFRVRPTKIEDAGADDVLFVDLQKDDELRKFVEERLFSDKREASRFWNLIKKPYDDPTPGIEKRAGLNFWQIIAVVKEMLKLSQGIMGKDGEEDPKEGDS